jgi:hypothetical protein
MRVNIINSIVFIRVYRVQLTPPRPLSTLRVRERERERERDVVCTVNVIVWTICDRVYFWVAYAVAWD